MWVAILYGKFFFRLALFPFNYSFDRMDSLIVLLIECDDAATFEIIVW